MSELIERQAAIDLLKQMRKDGNMVPWEGKDVFARIRKLPTIQPEKAQLSSEGTTFDLISRQAAIDAIDKALSRTFIEPCGEMILKDLPSAQSEPQWIPVSERLPRDGSWNIFTDGKNISVERYKADAIDHFFPPGRWFDLDDAVAWIPLPEPHKPNKKQSGKEGA